MNILERALCKYFSYKEIGWTEIGEEFTRYKIWCTRWFNIYLHKLYAPQWHPECHDHPWSFVTIILWPGYLENVNDHIFQRVPGSILYRPATFSHNVITPYGTSWSLVITGPKIQDWGFKPCDRSGTKISYNEYIDKYKQEEHK
jgi:hypothetical protein